jgi:homoserine dehydrogenase
MIDLNGWDTACKMVILANSLLNAQTTLEDVKVNGIANLTSEEVLSARRNGYAIKAIGEIETNGTISIRSTPKMFPTSHFLATIDGSERGMIFHTSAGDVSIKTEHAGPCASALAIIHDMIDIAREKKLK